VSVLGRPGDKKDGKLKWNAWVEPWDWIKHVFATELEDKIGIIYIENANPIETVGHNVGCMNREPLVMRWISKQEQKMYFL
jgi:hypothetical protein